MKMPALVRRGLLPACLAAAACVLPLSALRAQTPADFQFPTIGYHPQWVVDFDAGFYFRNGLTRAEVWRVAATNMTLPPAQRDAARNPLFLNPGEILYTTVNSIDGPGVSLEKGRGPRFSYPDPSGTHQRNFVEGRVELTWEGRADIRIVNSHAQLLSGGAEGLVTDGTRVYRNKPSSPSLAPQGLRVEIHAVDATNPPRNVRVWLPDPTNPDTASLVPPTRPVGSYHPEDLFHPLFLQKFADAPWGVIRFMDWGRTNDNWLQLWDERPRPSSSFQDPVAYELMVALCNAVNCDLWINVPFLTMGNDLQKWDEAWGTDPEVVAKVEGGADPEFVRKLARTIRHGSNGHDPYPASSGAWNNAGKTWKGLNPARRVFVELSNELWNGQFSQARLINDHYEDDPTTPAPTDTRWVAGGFATRLGISTGEYLARCFDYTWSEFDAAFGATGGSLGNEQGRIVRVAPGGGAEVGLDYPYQTHDVSLLDAIFNPAANHLKPHVFARTTYFLGKNSGLEEWINSTINPPAFDRYANYAGHPYWDPTTGAWRADLEKVIAESKRRLLAGPRPMLQTTVAHAYGLATVAYEGGPHLTGEVASSGGDRLINRMTQDPRFTEVYEIALNLKRASGFRTHMMFNDIGTPQGFGHFPGFGAELSAAVKYQVVKRHHADFANVRGAFGPPIGTRPEFVGAPDLPPASLGVPYFHPLSVFGGEGPVNMHYVGGVGPVGLAFDANLQAFVGTPTEEGTGEFLVRLVDADGDPSWRVFKIPVIDPAKVIQFQAESGVVSAGTVWVTSTDTAAAANAHRTATVTNTSSAPAPTQVERVSTHTFTVPAGIATAAGTTDPAVKKPLSLWVRVECPSTSGDSFYWQLDSAAWATAWLNASTYPAPYEWRKLKDYPDGLVAGPHQLRVGNRDRDTKIDKFLIQLTSAGTPGGLGPSVVLGSDDFSGSSLANWTFQHHDQWSGVGNWLLFGGELRLSNNVGFTSALHQATTAAAWKNYEVSATMRVNEHGPDDVGLVFYHQGPDSHYRFTMVGEPGNASVRRRLEKVNHRHNATAPTILAQDLTQGYRRSETYLVQVRVENGEQITVLIDGQVALTASLAGGQALSQGAAGLFNSYAQDAFYDNFVVRQLE